MTPGSITQFEKGRHYEMKVLFAPRGGAYINVQDKTGNCYKVEVEGKLKSPLHRLSGQVVNLVCTEVTEKGPEFSLDGGYFAMPEDGDSVRRGANIGLREGVEVEFKQSLVFSPMTHQPNSDQPFEIVKEIAAFLNTRGGDLYLGVDNEGYVSGLEKDLPHLGEALLMRNSETDQDWTYRNDIDSFLNKLVNAIRFYLGADWMSLIDPIEVIEDEGSGLHYARVHVSPSPEIVYLGRDENFVFRVGSSVVHATWGRQRDNYVRRRFASLAASPIVQRIDSIGAAIEAQKADVSGIRSDVQFLLTKLDGGGL